MGLRRFLAVVALLTLVLVALTLWAYPSSTDFAASNRYWNGLRMLGEQLAVKTVRSPRFIPGPAGGSVLIAIPYVPPSPGEIEALERHVAGGGVLILMDDFGFGNEVLARLGIPARFAGQVLVDPLFNHRTGRFPKIFDFPAGPASEGVKGLVLNHATVIRDTGGMTVMARSSPASFLDANENGRRDPDEPAGPFAVAAVGRVGAGLLVLVSDPSILLNSMLGLDSNRRFVQHLIGLGGGSTRAYLDASLLPKAPLDVVKDALARFGEVFALPVVVFAAVAAALVLPLAVAVKSPRR